MHISLRKFMFLFSIIIGVLALYLPAMATPPQLPWNTLLLTKTTTSCPNGNVWTWTQNSTAYILCIPTSDLNGYQGNTVAHRWWPSAQVYVPSKYGSSWVKSQDYNNPPPPPPPKQHTQPSSNGQNSDAIANTLCIITQALQGDIGKAIATIAIVVLGVGLFLGKISWPLAVATAIGIGMIFGAAELVQWLSSNSSQGC